MESTYSTCIVRLLVHSLKLFQPTWVHTTQIFMHNTELKPDSVFFKINFKKNSHWHSTYILWQTDILVYLWSCTENIQGESLWNDSYNCNFVLNQWCHTPSITLHGSLSANLAISLFSYPCISFSSQPLQHIDHTQQRYGISLITKSIWNRLTNSERRRETEGKRNNKRPAWPLIFNWIGGERMRSLRFFF